MDKQPVDVELIEKTLTKTWSLNLMEAGRYQKQLRNNSYRWLTDLTEEVKQLREWADQAEEREQKLKEALNRIKYITGNAAAYTDAAYAHLEAHRTLTSLYPLPEREGEANEHR